jgi:UDP-N-acetylmuramoyl-L-alanyl-D-glutamate--2,6-diaminopimelate ligase
MGYVATPRFLGDLVAEVPGAVLVRGDPSLCVRGITQDTRRLEPGDLFVAIAGFDRDGLTFVPDALSRGAVAVAAEHDVHVDAAWIRVPNARRALADLAAAFYGHPSNTVPVVGVTGTDGKTSTIHLLSAILEAHGLRTGWLTTVNTKIGAEERPNVADHTTPEAPLVQRTLAEMHAAELDVAILETSSHALELERVRGVRYRVGVFTNLSPEHLNFHGSFDAYRFAKSRLFEALPAAGLAVLNADDPSSPVMADATAARVLTYALDADADIRASEITLSPSGTRFVVDRNELRTSLVGRFNVANWLAAFGASTYFGATFQDFREAVRVQQPVPGRMNLVDAGQPFSVVVDFAHTPQALEKALDTVRTLVSGRVLLVFGLAGGRDFANRSVMGALAASKSDFFVITMDDPYHEDPASIAEQIASGAGRSAHYAIELDRRAAIDLAFGRAEPGDAVLLAGKGHEQRMWVRDERVPWNDARVARELLAARGFASNAVP